MMDNDRPTNETVSRDEPSKLQAALRAIAKQNRDMDNDRFFNELVVQDKVSKLEALMRAIPKWENVARGEVAAGSADMSQMSAEQKNRYDLYGYDWMNDQSYMIDVTTEGLFAGLAVSTASVVENTMDMLCKEQGVTLSAKPNWGEKRNGLEVKHKSSLDTLPGFRFANRARILGNCYKHNGGKTNQDWVDAHFEGELDQEIRYQDQNWGEIIEGVQTFLLELVKVLPAVS